MPGKNKTPILGWHASAEVQAWVRDEAERRGVKLSVVLEEIAQAAKAGRIVPVTNNDQDQGT